MNLVNFLDFKPEKLSIKTENEGPSRKVHQVRYENGGFYLTIDNIKGYFKFNGKALLNMIFSNNDQKINIIKYGKKFLKLLIMKMENYIFMKKLYYPIVILIYLQTK